MDKPFLLQFNTVFGKWFYCFSLFWYAKFCPPFVPQKYSSKIYILIYNTLYNINIVCIGLYFNKTKELVADKSKRKSFGWAIENWGNIESRSGRKQYSRIREYMFMALVAKTEVDWIALDKGEITSRKVVDLLIDKMEQYANYGFDYIADKLEDNPDHFFKDRAFLNEIIKFMISSEDVKTDNNDDEEAESLD